MYILCFCSWPIGLGWRIQKSCRFLMPSLAFFAHLNFTGYWIVRVPFPLLLLHQFITFSNCLAQICLSETSFVLTTEHPEHIHHLLKLAAALWNLQHTMGLYSLHQSMELIQNGTTVQKFNRQISVSRSSASSASDS